MKLAFCFLSYGDIEQHEIWNSFFKDVSSDKCSVLIHMKNRKDTSIISGARVIPNIPTTWGGFSLVKVQQALIEAAFEDKAVTKFIILSGDSIPLYRFDTIYEQLCKDDKGYLSMYVPTRNINPIGVVNRRAWPNTMPWTLKKASQWCILNRTHVQLLCDHFYMLTQVFQNANIPDEHMYVKFFHGIKNIHTFHNKMSTYYNWDRRTYKCSIHHHASPATYHTGDFNAINVANIYDSGALFMRKVCKTANVRIDWTAFRPLRVVSDIPTQTFFSVKTTPLKKLFKKAI